MTKKKITKDQKEDFKIELEGLIEKSENMANGMKKLIRSFENKNAKKG